MLTLESCEIYIWLEYIYIVSIDAGAQVAIMLLAFGPYMVVVYDWDRLYTLGRAPCTRETLLDFRE